jgi:hypothetical protein
MPATRQLGSEELDALLGFEVRRVSHNDAFAPPLLAEALHMSPAVDD